ncbi:hook protein [Proteus mirabilis]|uniref:hook protein n=2 Tax=Proteus mirabilis TaxID=584 RepID=UPI0031FDF03A
MTLISRFDHPTRLTKEYNHYSVQGCKQEIDMTIEQLQEENTKLKEAIIAIHSNCEECEYQGYGTFYAVEQDYVNYAYELAQQTE